jgi:hypothetical protein
MNLSGAVRRHFRAVLLSSAGHRWPVGARLLVPARKVTMMTLAYLRARWPLIEIEAAREFVGNSSVEVLSPVVCSRLELRSAGCSWVVGVDAVRRTPDGHLPEQAGARAAVWECPGGCSVGSAGLFSDAVGEVGDELGTLGEVVAPDRIDLESGWDARQPWQRPVIGCRGLRKSPVEDGGHVASGGEVAALSSIVEMAERVVACFGGEVEEVGSEGGPGRFAGEAGDVAINRVEVGNNLRSEEVFGGGVAAVGVALDSVEQPGGRVAEFTQGRRGGGRRVVAGQDLLQGLGRRRGATAAGRITLWGSPSPTTFR